MLLRSKPPVLLRQVRETRVVCKGWSERLAWIEAGDGLMTDEDGALRHVLMSAHGRLEGISAPFIQVPSNIHHRLTLLGEYHSRHDKTSSMDIMWQRLV